MPKIANGWTRRRWSDPSSATSLCQIGRDPFRPAVLSGRLRMALWVLRIFVVIVGAMVIYTFFAQL